VSTNETFSLPGDPVVEGDELDSNGEGDTNDTTKPTEIAAADLPTPEPWDGVSRINILWVWIIVIGKPVKPLAPIR